MIKKIIAALLLIGHFGMAQQRSTFVDTRDGQVYKTIEIGDKVWMAQNLNYETKGSIYNEKKRILYANTPYHFSSYYDNYCYRDSLSTCEKYGRFYTWESAMTACPVGWHLPDKAEVDSFLTILREPKKRQILYNKLIPGGSSGFDILFSGYGSLTGKAVSHPHFTEHGRYCSFWTSVRYPLDLNKKQYGAGFLGFILFPNKVLAKYYKDYLSYENLYNVRCIKDKW